MRAVVRLFALSLLIVSAPAVFAADPIFRVGFTGVQVKDVAGGKIHFVEVEIASNEENADAKLWDVFVQVWAGGGKYSGTEAVTKQTKLRPPLRPLRFQVFFPTPTVGDRRPDLSPISRMKVKYSLQARLQVKRAGTNDVVKDVMNEISYEIAAGGTPSCQLQ